jgi:hypothetical protein
MKPDLLPTFTAVGLALMAGAAATHWSGIDERIALARTAAAQPAGIWPPAHETTPAASAPQSTATSAPLATNRPATSAASNGPQHAGGKPAAAAALPAAWENRVLDLVKVIERVHDENQDLRDQVREANRELLEIQFRLDAQSEKFRPLRTTQEPLAVDGPGVLPPLEIP